jgi:hypothetical protein
MSEKLERMLRIALMNQVEIMTALEELLGPEPESEDDLATRAEVQVNLTESIDQTIQALKALKDQEPTDSGGLAGQA